MGIFKKREEKALEREVAYRMAKNKLENYIAKCQAIQKKYWERGKRAAKICDEKLLRQFAVGHMAMEERVRSGEKLLLFLEGIKLKHDEVQLTRDFVGFAREAGEATLKTVDITGVAKMQTELSKAMTEAGKVGISLDTVTQTLSESVLATPEVAEAKVTEVTEAMEGEAVAPEKELDTKIEEKLKEIEKKMKEEV